MLDYLNTLELAHNGDCHLLGMSSDKVIYAEEVYGDDDWLAQHALTLDGDRVQSVDEEDGQRADLVPLTLPTDLVRPQPVRHTQRLDFSGPRLRGLREAERIGDLVRPLTVPTRMTLGQRLGVAPAALLGIAESRVLAEALLTSQNSYLVCRRVRIAYVLSQPQRDAENQPYDYDTLVLYVAHPYDIDSGDIDVEPEIAFAGLPGVELMRPMDCLTANGYLCVADGGHEARHSRIHIWKIGE